MDPLSIAASVTVVVTAALSVARRLNEVVDTVRNAPRELRYLAGAIENLAMLIITTVQLIEDHPGLYRDQLAYMLRDVRWQFQIVQDVVAKAIASPETSATSLDSMGRQVGDDRRESSEARRAGGSSGRPGGRFRGVGSWSLRRLRWLLESRKMRDMLVKLEALKTTMILILQIARMAERETSPEPLEA